MYSKGIPTVYEYYVCPGKNPVVSAEKCTNRRWRCDELDQLLWDKVEALLSQPEVVLAGIKAVEADSADASHFEQELTDVDARLGELDGQQEKLLQQSLMGFPEELVIKENEKINSHRAVLLPHRAELESKIDRVQRSAADMDGIKLACEMVSRALGSLSYEDKRLAIEALDIKVWIKHDELVMEGSIPMPDDLSNLYATSRCWSTPTASVFPRHAG